MTLEELGALLRAERERRGLSIEDVSAHLKISVRKLRALEDGDASAMPHPAYVKGFVRSYATYLGMAASEVVEAMQVVSSHMPENTEENVRPVRSAPAPSAPSKSGGNAFSRLLLLAVALAALAGGSYAVWKSGFLETLHSRQSDVVRPSLPMQDDSARLLLEAMIFAARADGHIDENEKAHIQEAAARLFPGQSADALVARSLEQPLDPGALAARVRNREEALDLYRISAMITGGDHFMERSYLDALAASLGIGAAEKATLDAQVAEFRQQQAAM